MPLTARYSLWVSGSGKVLDLRHLILLRAPQGFVIGFVCLDGVFLSFSSSLSGNPTLGLYSRIKIGPFILCMGQLTSDSSVTMT